MKSDLQITLEDRRDSKWYPLYVGDRSRFATATSVRFVDPQTLICCSMLGRRLYLIRFCVKDGTHSVLSSIDTTYAGKPIQTDLCDLSVQGDIVTSNCSAGSMSLYKLEGETLRKVGDLHPKLGDNFVHGARFYNETTVVATTHRAPQGAHFYRLPSLKKLLYVKTTQEAKDICFLPDARAILITCAGSASRKPRKRYASTAMLLRFDLKTGTYKVLKQQKYPVGQFDSGTVHGDRLYAADSGRGSLLVIDTNTLQQVDQIDGYPFPHGIDINYGMMAVATYGDNSIHVTWI